MKVALVCDWLTEKGGAEDVLMEFHKIFPDAPIYTSQYRKRRIDWFKDAEVKTGWLNYFPVFSRRFIAPLRQQYFKNLDLSEYDLVISVTGCDAKLIKTSGVHLCYCHVPTQYYWGKREEYLKDPGFGLLNPLVRVVYKSALPKLRSVDYEAAKNPDRFITISKFAKEEIKKYYEREAKIVNPPVNMKIFTGVKTYEGIKEGKSQMKKAHNKTIKNQESQERENEQKFCTNLENVENLSVLAKLIAKYPDGFFLNFSRQVNWKRLDLAVKCCKNLNLPLVMVGNGPENKKLRKLAKKSDNITFVDFLPKTDLAMLCSLAKAFIFPSKEPFGIAPVEALAAGCPVVALKEGGALDYIKDGKNGIFFEEQEEKSLETALMRIVTGNVSLDSPEKISKSVEKYSKENFEKNIEKELKNLPKKKTKKVEKKIGSKKLKTSMVLCLPLILFLSNFPIVNLGDTASMHLELSLPLLWLAVFSVISLKDVFKYLKDNITTSLLAFPVMAVISLLHTSNLLRGVLTFGVLICLLISVLGIYLHLKSEKLPEKFRKVIIIETLAICAVCFIQAVFDRLGVGREYTLLCPGCTTDILGFAHPNGFAIEPQFMGSLLIAPLFLTLNSLLENKNKKSQISLIVATLIIGTTLFFTFSRGAIFATIIATFYLIFKLKSVKKFLKIFILGTLSFSFSLGLQIALSATTPIKTADTVINQVSLGGIKLVIENEEFDEPPVDAAMETTVPLFDGYIAESTDRRLELSNFAVRITNENPSNLLFGTGLGSAGTEMYRRFPERQGHEKEIVQNQYLETLLEMGLLGIIALALTIVTFVKLEKLKFDSYTKAITIAFVITIIFFSGLPNALHVYLLPVLCYNLMYDKDRLSRIQK